MISKNVLQNYRFFLKLSLFNWAVLSDRRGRQKVYGQVPPHSYRSLELDRKNTVIGKYRGKAATSCNGGIGKIAALPSFESIYYFCRELLVGKCVGSRNLANTLGVVNNGGCWDAKTITKLM